MADQKKMKKEVRMISSEKRIRLKKSLKKIILFDSLLLVRKGREIVNSPIFVFVSVENINFDVDYLEKS